MSFEIENKVCNFKRITTKDGLAIKNAMLRLADNKADKEANALIDEMALKYLEITHNGVKNDGFTTELLATQFENPFAIMEISAQFLNLVNDFLAKLPSFQNQN